MGSVAKRNYFGVLDELDSMALSVHQNRCIQVRNGNVSCLRCATVCTSGCLSIVDGELVVDQQRCVGCGTCASVCPTAAIGVRVPSDAQLLDHCVRASRQGVLRIVCHSALEADGEEGTCEGVPVVCLGRLNESLLVSLAAEGIGEVELVCGTCEQCSYRPGRVAAETACTSAQNLLKAWDRAFAWSFVTRESSRRLPLFPPTPSSAAVCERGVFVTKPTPRRAHVTGDGTLPHFLPERHESIIDALADLGEPVAERVESRLWGTASIDRSRCRGCRLCSVFCPTGALWRITEADGTVGLVHYPADCVQCRCCEQVCRQGAIKVVGEVATDDLLSGRGNVLEVAIPLRDPQDPDLMRRAVQESCRAVVSEKR
ncbi:4Fe-4S binding protein [Adlercreutzia equolifaciens]|uniref:4Fe-4S binding protein n=1 Tax=Adlercreutzia equolifaciens TaxID=446660 RepID=UPI0023B1D229|nr:4Fe-4S binding protein [Adlercreutzia equolifaciens]MDE8701839.1 4Fe-4S binding protein [Adlercreutzia equolifaciens]